MSLAKQKNRARKHSKLDTIQAVKNKRDTTTLQEGEIYYKDSRNMKEIPDNSINLIITSPPYFNIKDYALDGYQKIKKSKKVTSQIGDISNFDLYIQELSQVWHECFRVLAPNGKLIINVPLMPMLKKEFNTHFNRHIFDINSEIEHSILRHTDFYLMDVYIWNRTNSSKRLMFGSYPYPRNFYAQNTIEFISVYVKDGKSQNNIPPNNKKQSKLTQEEWVSFTKQIWDIPIPNKGDVGFGKHPALMPEAIPYRCIKLYSFVGDVILDPFAGSGTTLKIAKQLGRKYVGYEIMKNYKKLIDSKLNSVKCSNV